MHANMKFYVVSVGGIFISLGIGMLVEFNLNYDQELSNQQAEIIKGLDSKFEILKSTNDTLEEELNKLNLSYDKAVEFINNNTDKLITGELESQNIGIITINNINSNYIQDSITNASGSIMFDINITSKVLDTKILEELSNNIDREIKTTKDMVSYLLESMNDSNFEYKLKQIEELGLIKINTLKDNLNEVDSIALMNGTLDESISKDIQDIEKTIVDALKNENKYLIGAKTVDSKSDTKIYSENGISTIDNINEGSGQLALVSLLKNKNTVGNFGTGEDAQSLIPFNN